MGRGNTRSFLLPKKFDKQNKMLKDILERLKRYYTLVTNKAQFIKIKKLPKALRHGSFLWFRLMDSNNRHPALEAYFIIS